MDMKRISEEGCEQKYLAVRIDDLQFDEDSDETACSKIMIKGLRPPAGIGLDAVGPDTYIDLMADVLLRSL